MYPIKITIITLRIFYKKYNPTTTYGILFKVYFLPLHLFRLLLLLFFIAFFPCISHGKEEKSFHICYFSLNNEKEFTTAEEFTDKLNKYSNTRKVTVKEYLTEGEEPNESFQKMMDEGAECDGLVISGHHTGSFGGKRSQGSLRIDFLEELACKPEYQEWFQKIQALWLQGCRTLGVKIEAIGADGETADDHTSRVGAELAEDDLNQSLAQLNMEFSGTLDQDNPLSTRYLRLFPHANVFGWTKSAPGEQAGSHLSIPYHMAHIAYRLNGKGNFPPDPTEGELSEEDAALYTQALSTTLTALNSGVTICEQILTEAWIHHGYNEAGSFHFINRDTMAHSRLFSSDSKDFLLDVKRIECLLRTANNEEDILLALKEATSSEEKIHHLLHAIYEKFKGATSEKEIVRKFLLEESIFIKFLKKKLYSKELGILRKIDYYAFYRDLKEEKWEDLESSIRKKVFEQLEKPHDPNDWNTIDYNITLLKSLGKHDMLPVKDLLNIVEKTPNPYILEAATYYIKNFGYTGIEKKEILELVLKNKTATAYTLSRVAYAIGSSKTPIPNAGEFLKSIMEDKRASSQTLNQVAEVIGISKTPILNAGEFLKSIMEDERATSQTLNRVASAIGSSKTPIPNAEEFLKSIMEDERATEYTLTLVASAIGSSKTLIPNAGEFLKSIMEDKRASSETLTAVAFAIGDSKTPIPNAGEFLKSIMEDKRATSETLTAVAFAIGNSKTPIPNAGEFLKSIMEDERATFETLTAVASAIGDSKTLIPNAEEFLKNIMKDERAVKYTLETVASAIGRSKTPIPNAGEFLKSIIEDKRATDYTLNRVAYAIENSKTPIPNAEELFKSIIEHERATEYTLTLVASAIGNSKTPIPNAGEFLKSIIEDERANSETLMAVASAIKNSKTPIQNKDELLRRINQRNEKLPNVSQ